jgi:hypothetical protein
LRNHEAEGLTEVEQLSRRRARLPLRRQLILYLNPFALFKDAARGPAWMREHALSYNRAMRWMLCRTSAAGCDRRLARASHRAEAAAAQQHSTRSMAASRRLLHRRHHRRRHLSVYLLLGRKVV